MNERSYKMLKLAVPVLVAIGSGITTWTVGTVDEIETDMQELRMQLSDSATQREVDRAHTEQFLETLKTIADSVKSNSEGLLALEVQVHSVVERNNKMIESLIEKAQK